MTDLHDSAPAPLTSPSQPTALPKHSGESAAADSNVAAQGRAPLDLDAIRARADAADETGNLGKIVDSLADIPALLAEVTALRAELTAARVEPTPDDGSDVGVEFDPREPLMPRAARAERTEPATGDRPAMFHVTDPEHDAPDGAVVDGYERQRDTWVRLDTEPATGEDVEQVRAEVTHILSAWWVSEGEESPEQLAGRILAALDLPGRERALQERLTEAEATIVRAQNALGSDHPVWWVLDDYDGSMTSVTELVAERDDARQRLANVTSACDDLKFANDQLHVARDNTAELLKEARAEIRQERARVAEEIAVALIAAGNDVNQNLAWMYPNQAAEIARQHATAEAAPDGGDEHG